ncbi:MAG: hypothetical protein KC613_26615, partial [Myxococcales bacterium]|nr:hypothetical protein [Myxococcales bacterium]
EASLLWLLWPNHVPAADALTALLAGDLESSDRLYFAEREGPGLVEALAPDEVRQALDFICEGRLSTYQRSPLRDALLQRAWDLADEPSMAKALGAALASEAQRHALHRADIDLGGAPAAQVEAVAVAAIEAAQRPVDVELGDLGLVPTVEAVVEHAERACQTPGEHALASRWMHWLEYYWRLPAELHPRIRTVAQTLGITDKWDVRLNPPPPKPMPRRQRPPEPPWHVRFRADLAEVASWDNPFGAWRALAGRYRPHDLDPDELTGSDAQQVRKLALSFLASWSAVTPAWLGDWLFRSAVSTALRWHDAPPALGVAPIWVAALVAEHAPSDAPEPVRAVVQASTQPLAASVELLLVHAPSTVATALSWLDRPLDGALRDRALGLLARPADPEQGQGTGPQLPAVSRAHLLRVLLDLDDQAQAWTWSLTPLHDGDFWIAAPLFAHDPQGAWEAVDAQLRADEEWARDLLRAVADTHEAWVSLSWRGPEQLQWVIARVTALFGEQLQPAHGRVTAENRLYERRRILLDALFDGGHDEHLAALAKDCALPPSYIERARQNRPHRGLSIAEAARFERRLLTPGELLERVLEALEDLQREMWDRHSPWRAFFDWNHAKGSKEVWRKQEVHACVLLVNLLQPHLRGALPTVVLEPQEQGSEDRIDIYFEAHAEASKRRLTLKVEVKWDNYNPVKGVTEQLRDYLKDSPDVAGLLLVLDPPDGDFQLQSGGRTPVDEQALQRACDALSADLGGRPVQPFILRLGRQRSRPRGKK